MVKTDTGDAGLPDMREYRQRIIEGAAEDCLRKSGMVLIEGIRHCGKTGTAGKFCRSGILLDDPSRNFRNRMLAGMDPSLALEGEMPRLVDEWQEAPGNSAPPQPQEPCTDGAAGSFSRAHRLRRRKMSCMYPEMR